MAEAVEEKVRKGLRAADFRDAAIRPISCVNIVKNGPLLPLTTDYQAAPQHRKADFGVGRKASLSFGVSLAALLSMLSVSQFQS